MRRAQPDNLAGYEPDTRTNYHGRQSVENPSHY